jgi:UDP-N-acetylglucosamine--N-acetylmuramyl-(pentapeptide) pyrophosphoryl-undecaprenol N-acetylglucosamine transferase
MKTLMVMAGGTGGHVFPALAVANYLREQGVRIVWLGTKSGIEAKVVPAAGFDICWMSVTGLRGKGLKRLLTMPFMLGRALIQGIKILRRERPDALLGMGGFAAGPGAISGVILGKPVLIHEANASAGLTNRLLAPLACRVMTGFPNTKGVSKRSEWTGNPVRNIISANKGDFESNEHRNLRVLIFGGSQGALALNRLVPSILAKISKTMNLEIRHQTGKAKLDEVKSDYDSLSLESNTVEFIDDMGEAYRWADIVICRSGAMTVAELCIAGKVSILVPYPYAAGDHQTANASFMADVNAGFLVPESELSFDRINQIFTDITADPDRFKTISDAALKLSRPNATQDVATQCLEVMHA